MSAAAAVTAAFALTLAVASPAWTQTFVTPSVGYDTGADAACVNLVSCAPRNLSVAVAGERMRRTVGIEEEVTYARDFFGAAPNLSSSVLTLTTNAIVRKGIRQWQPYAAGGIGLLRTSLHFTEASFYQTNRKDVAWDVGGGVVRSLALRMAIRAEFRYLRAFKEVPLTGFSLSQPKLSFGRANIGVMVRF